MSSLPSSQHAERVFAVLGKPEESLGIAASWRRCLVDHHLDPEQAVAPTVLSNFELRYARDQAGRLMRVADPELDRLHRLVESVGYAVLMADLHGAVIARRVTEADEWGCRHWSLWTGAMWSEEIEGTNGVGTCLAEERAVTVHRDQHFRRRYGHLTCTVSPLFDAVGRLAGALDVSSFRPDPEGRLLPLVMAAVQDTASRIEAACFRDLYARYLILTLPSRPDGFVSSVPLLAMDTDRRIVGATRSARILLNIDEDALERGTSIGDVLSDSVDDASFAAATRNVLIGALAQAQGNVSEAARLLGISRATLHRKIRSLNLQRDNAFR
ncbi:Fis family transcriptional regulator [Labrys miyagiensis]